LNASLLIAFLKSKTCSYSSNPLPAKTLRATSERGNTFNILNNDVKIGLKIPKIDYSETAKHYDKLRPLETEIWLSKIIELGGIKEEDIVLDFGCGTGRYTLSIFKSVYPWICGLDVSFNMIKQA